MSAGQEMDWSDYAAQEELKSIEAEETAKGTHCAASAGSEISQHPQRIMTPEEYEATKHKYGNHVVQFVEEVTDCAESKAAYVYYLPNNRDQPRGR